MVSILYQFLSNYYIAIQYALTIPSREDCGCSIEDDNFM